MKSQFPASLLMCALLITAGGLFVLRAAAVSPQAGAPAATQQEAAQDSNPSPSVVDQLPNFENYSMEGRTYRYFKGKPLYPFGYGLSYTTFSFSDLTIPQATVNAGDPVEAEVTVTNAGKVAGDEVAELYLKFPDVKGAPNIALRGFQRIHLDPGQSQKLHFVLKNRDLGMVTEDGHSKIVEGDYTMSIGGGQPDTGAPVVTGHFHIDGWAPLPE